MLNTLFESTKLVAANLFLYSPFQQPAGSSKDDGYNNTNINQLSPAQNTPALQAIWALVLPVNKIDIFKKKKKTAEKASGPRGLPIPETIKEMDTSFRRNDFWDL